MGLLVVVEKCIKFVEQVNAINAIRESGFRKHEAYISRLLRR